jgi:hypothetical protein
MTTQQFEEWSKGTTIIDRKPDLHTSYGLTTWSWLIEKNGKTFPAFYKKKESKKSKSKI